MPDLSSITLPDNNTYNFKDTIARASIPYGEVDSTSTSTAFTATVSGITSLFDGVCVMLKNGVVTSASGFTININNLGAKPVYSNMATGNSITPTNPTRETTIFNINYTLLFVYSEDLVTGGCWINYRGYDANTNTIGYQLRTNSSVLKTYDKFRYYKILFTSADGTHWIPASTATDNSATSVKAVNQRPIDPFGTIVYCSANTNYAAEADIAATSIWQQYTFALGYSFNRTGAALTLTTKRPVYVKCAPQSNGSAIIDSTTPYVQTLPSSADGKIYIFLGIAYSATNIELQMEHPVYEYKDGAIRLWTNAASGSSVEPATVAPAMDGSAAVGSSAKYAREDHVHPSDTAKADTADYVHIDVTADALWNLTLTQDSIVILRNNVLSKVTNNDIFTLRLVDGNNILWISRLNFDGNSTSLQPHFSTPFVEFPNDLGYGWVKVYYNDELGSWKAVVEPFPVYQGGVS